MNYGKSKRKRYFSSNLMAKKKRDLFVKPGIKGFLCTCNGNEKQCIRESYNILNEYADKLFGEEKLRNDDNVKNSENDVKTSENDVTNSKDNVKNSSGDGDVMDEFENEINAMKTQATERTRRFQAVDTNIINCVFVETHVDDPVALHHNIVNDLFETKQKKVRFLLRMVPIEVTCRAFMDDLEKTANSLFDKHFKADATTYAIVFNKRHNSSLDRDAVIEKLAAVVQEKNGDHKVNLGSPNLTIIVEVMKSICGLAVVRDYFRFSKYNLHSLCGIEDNNKSSTVEKVDKKETSSDQDEEPTVETKKEASNDQDEEPTVETV